MNRHYSMPFGAELQTDGRVRFRLWAPALTRLSLALEGPGEEQLLEMEPRAGGWFELTSAAARAGSRYRFVAPDGQRVPDPAARFNPEDVHGPSEVIDPTAFCWEDADWHGRPWQEAVIYELHVGAFSPSGTFDGVRERLDHLAALGVTALELMPVADFPGARNWGYDGVLPFAPDSRYGRPEALKRLVQAAHQHGLMVLLDVVYNHFGPEGNYLHTYAPTFFTHRHTTPWGAAINFDGEHSQAVRRFFIDNALYWLEEFNLDGLRLDAVHAIYDDGQPDILIELAEAVRAGPARERPRHLVLENDDNATRYLAREAQHPHWYTAQWNDDCHHALHTLLTGESQGYYADYAQYPIRLLVRCLSEGFAFQGEPSPYRGGAARGEPSAGLPSTAFVNFLQNHDQIGNRALGERITQLASPRAVRAAHILLLLAPAPPLLFMGEEWDSQTPFPFFCDFGAELAGAVRDGRRREFAHFPEFSAPGARERIPDPNDAATFALAQLDWSELTHPIHAGALALHRELLALRRQIIAPRLPARTRRSERLAEHALRIEWQLTDGALLGLLANLGQAGVALADTPGGELLYASEAGLEELLQRSELPGWSVVWLFAPTGA
ncbi:malto-oligosyltrehalose trehalohydrolase [Nitrococcus mobilis]|uniref:Malto-oligosyltrehalose trehalohydrolase n=1 Tax=Nitrococcus mobilis Nb-231 TaxID=314278 RepID=A4BM93_9GAMM|nr:malto-oligosyltrehalose trehalohydrolase [Nitrococcus mobilis]EAR23431.1 Alpha amylase [Nitrococcus mobilis Nb-231]